MATPDREHPPRTQRVKFYQTDTFTVGNRLLDASERSVQATTERANAITSGHRACQGCGEALGARYAIDAAMRATNNRLMACNATGCLEVFTTPYPESAWQLPWIHSLFGNTAAVASGMAAALKAKGKTDVRVLAQAKADGDNAITKLGPGKGFAFKYDYCKGCGLCVSECPCGAIAAVPET
jgi:pyruvate ferredoxin oxidoreductase beta subunit